MESFDKFFSLLCLIVLIFIGYEVFLFIQREMQWYKIVPIECVATLLSTDFIPSTRESHMTPIFSQGKVSWAITSTGHGERYTTVWDCGKYGRLVSDNKDIFRFAQPKSILLLKVLGDEARIHDIKRQE